MNEIVIYGAGGHGRETALLLQQINQASPTPPWRVLGFVDDAPPRAGSCIGGLPVLGAAPWLGAHPQVYVALGVGQPKPKQQMLGRFDISRAPVLVHPSVHVSDGVTIGAGSQLHAGVILTTDITIGCAVTVNRRVDISHDNVIDDYATLGPSVSLAGNVRIGTLAELGIRATCIPGVRIGPRSIVGAGAVVVRDLPADVTAAGVPARILSQHRNLTNALSVVGAPHPAG